MDVPNEPDCSCGRRQRPNDPHSELCIEFQPLRKRLRESEEALRSRDDNVLATSQTLPSATTYLTALFDMMDRTFWTAKQVDGSEDLIQESLFYAMKVMGRVDNFSCLIAKERIPFILLRLERYDDLCAYIDFEFTNGTLTQEQRMVAQSGGFPFTSKEGSFDLNIFGKYGYNPATFQSEAVHVLPCLLAIFFMNFHIQDERKAFLESVNAFFDTSLGQKIEPVWTVLKEMAEGDDKFKTSQPRLLETLMDTIDRRNASILPALIHPEPLNSEFSDGPLEGLYFPRCPAEAYDLLKLCEDELERTPAARAILVERYGERPQYHHGPFDFAPHEINPTFDYPHGIRRREDN